MRKRTRFALISLNMGFINRGGGGGGEHQAGIKVHVIYNLLNRPILNMGFINLGNLGNRMQMFERLKNLED